MLPETAYSKLCEQLKKAPKTWLVTGVAGFIGSNLLETLLKLDQKVVGLDNFFAGYQHNLNMVQANVEAKHWANFKFINGDVRDLNCCHSACAGVDYVLHQAALGSVPRSIAEPILSNECNITGHLNMLVAARDAGIKGFVYAASSSTYGDEPTLPKQEDLIGKPLSPYAITKYVNELYGDIFYKCYGFSSIGLRYFNVFGQRQDPYGAYAAVIPLWFAALLKNEPIQINGDGTTSRDFCYIDNCVQANILAACASFNASPEAQNQIYNIAVGQRTSLNELFVALRNEVSKYRPQAALAEPVYAPFREGDVLHSLADISKAKRLLGYEPQFTASQGLALAGEWYSKNL